MLTATSRAAHFFSSVPFTSHYSVTYSVLFLLAQDEYLRARELSLPLVFFHENLYYLHNGTWSLEYKNKPEVESYN